MSGSPIKYVRKSPASFVTFGPCLNDSINGDLPDLLTDDEETDDEEMPDLLTDDEETDDEESVYQLEALESLESYVGRSTHQSYLTLVEWQWLTRGSSHRDQSELACERDQTPLID